jgi:16S rRNA (guanine527-N7)-methyltransferase
VSGPGAPPLRDVLEESRRLGLLGPGSVEGQIEHARSFAAAIPGIPDRFLDLGSGGGLPGLVLALAWPYAAGLLLDSGARRVAHLESACRRLGVADRIATLQARAEEAARRLDLRAAFDLVVARSFGAPAVTAECAVGFLAIGGRLVVSEPPEPGAGRWPSEGLAQLGFGPAEIRRGDGASVAVIPLNAPPSDRWPRRSGIPTKRPLWG